MDIREGAKKIKGKKLTSVSFKYVCVAENAEMFFSFSRVSVGVKAN